MDFLVGGHELIQLNLTVTINIKLLKRLLELHAFFFGGQMSGHESDSGLFQLFLG